MTETQPQFVVGTDAEGRFTVVDQSGPRPYPMLIRYGTREEAQERADRYNDIKAGKL